MRIVQDIAAMETICSGQAVAAQAVAAEAVAAEAVAAEAEALEWRRTTR